MKNLIMVALASLGMLLPIGCTSSNPPPPIVNTIVCDAQTALANAAGAAVATKLVCANVAAVQASVLALLQKDNLCQQTSATAKKALKGPIANALCPSLVAGIVASAQGTLPADWSCTGGSVPADLTNLLTPICLGINF